jgi:general nucleoside transport system permease protein
VSASLGEEERQDRTAPVNKPADSAGGTSADSPRVASDVFRRLGLAVLAITLSFVVSAIFIAVSGKNPALAYWSLIRGAFGSIDSVAFALNKSTPYVLAGVGVALCFRARVINIGGEGQIAVGGIAASGVALSGSALPGFLLIPLAILAGSFAGAIWAAIPAAMRLTRGVHEVLGTLLMNFVGALLVSEALHGPMGEVGAGFPQSPLFPEQAWLPALIPGTDLHIGIILAVIAVIVCHVGFWHMPWGFRLRLIGSTESAAAYAGVSVVRGFAGVMLVAGALAGIAGSIEVLGVHYRLIQGFSQGFGFNAVAIALLASLNPAAVLPAGLFFGFLEAGALAMQREIGVPSSLIYVIQGLTMVFVLCALGISSRRQRV